MPDFQFTPILTVVTNDDGTLKSLDWDWSDSGQGEWNPVTLEHDDTPTHEQVCKALDGWGQAWAPEAVRPFGTGPLHEPIDPKRLVLDRLLTVANARQEEANKVARQQNPTIDPERVMGSDSTANLLKTAVEELARAFGIEVEAKHAC